MQTFKIIPQLRDNCIIQGKKEWLKDYSLGDTIFLISNTPTKKYSAITKIDGIEYAEKSNIYIDHRNLEKLAEGDKVYLLKYNPAEAIEVEIQISTEFNLISKGDWTVNIKPSLYNKLIDIGQEVTFLVPWEGGTPIVGTGIISSTLPNPPVFIGDKTVIFLSKAYNEVLSKIKALTMIIKEARVDILENQMEMNIIDDIRRIKNQNYPYRGQKYQFKATNPKQLFASILQIFSTLEIVERPTENDYGENSRDYFASAVFLHRKNASNLYLIDIQVVAREYSGTLIIWVTGENEEVILSTLKIYEDKIIALKQGLEQKIEILNIQCPECGGTLPIKDIQLTGVVECNYCAKISKIPKALRY